MGTGHPLLLPPGFKDGTDLNNLVRWLHAAQEKRVGQACPLVKNSWRWVPASILGKSITARAVSGSSGSASGLFREVDQVQVPRVLFLVHEVIC